MTSFIKKIPHWPLFVGLAFLFLGLIALLWGEPAQLWRKIVYAGISEIGFAFIIAWIVSIFVEEKARAEYTKEITEREIALSKNIFDYLYSVRLPKSVFELVQKYVFMETIIKTNQRLEYELISHDPGWIIMRCAFEYQLKNISSEPVMHSVRFHTSEIVGLNPPKDERVGLTRLFIGKDIPPEQFEKLDEAADDPVGQRRYRKDVLINPDATLDVRVSFYQMKKSRDADLWQSLLLCENVTLVIRFDQNIFSVQLEPVHPADQFDRDDKEDNCIVVTLDRPLLPRNGIFIWWNERENEDSSPPEAQEGGGADAGAPRDSGTR